jgi:cytochrome c553
MLQVVPARSSRRARGWHSNNGGVNMINNRIPTAFGPTAFGVLVVLVALSAPAKAADAVPSPSADRELGAKLLVCGACHGGQNGVPKNATIPILAGQQENYLVKQLHDFQSGDRNFEVMTWMAKTLSPTEVASAAAYFAKKDWPAHPVAAAAPSPPAAAAVCQICHQQNFVGGVAAPRLAGQSYDYLVEAMRRFAEGERTNNADMMKLMQAFSPAERDAMARYISGL